MPSIHTSRLLSHLARTAALSSALLLCVHCDGGSEPSDGGGLDGSAPDAARADAAPDDAQVAPDAAADGGMEDAIVLGERKAFPTAHGYARYTVGGRGGDVIAVTNTNADGPGSLRAALTASGPRVIVFEVAGNIDFGETIYIRDDHYTVLGQTAPGQGVAVFSDTGGIESRAGEGIWRHMRFRGSAVVSNLRIIARRRERELTNVIVDHCSFAWPSSPPDESEMNISFSGDAHSASGHPDEVAHDFTVQASILGESTRGSLLYKGAHSATFYRNLWVSNNERNPLANYPDDIPDGSQQFESLNNIVHNARGAMSVALGGIVRASGNVWTLSTEQEAPYASGFLRGESLGGGTPSEGHVYLSDNLFPEGQVEQANLDEFLRDAPYEETDLRGDLIAPAASLDEMLPHLGAFPWARDPVDARFVQEYLDRVGVTGVFDGTLPPLASAELPVDANDDHVADDFAAEHGIADASEQPMFFTIDGLTFDNRAHTGGSYDRRGYEGGTPTAERLYTWREIYWHYLAGDFAPHHWR